MVTRIEVGQFKNTDRGIIASKKRELVAELPDIQGEYETCFGRVGLNFRRHEERGYKYIELEIGKTKELQTRDHREKRSVNVSNEGKGQVQISKGRILYITTDAFKNEGR